CDERCESGSVRSQMPSRRPNWRPSPTQKTRRIPPEQPRVGLTESRRLNDGTLSPAATRRGSTPSAGAACVLIKRTSWLSRCPSSTLEKRINDACKIRPGSEPGEETSVQGRGRVRGRAPAPSQNGEGDPPPGRNVRLSRPPGEEAKLPQAV